jgi:WD40 repeat protein
MSSKRVLDLELSTEREIHSSHRGIVTCLSLDPLELRYVLSGGTDGMVSLTDLGALDDIVKPIAGASSGGAGQRPVAVANVLKCSPAATAGQTKGLVSGVEWYGRDCGCFISADYAGRCQLWDTNAFKVAYTFDLFPGTLSTFGANSARGAFGTYNPRLGQPARPDSQTPGKVLCAKVRSNESDRALIACGLSNAAVKLCDTRTGDACLTVRGHTQSVSCLQWSMHSAYELISGSFDGTIKTWDIRRIGGVAQMSDGSGGESHQAVMSFDWRGDHAAVATQCAENSAWSGNDGHDIKRFKLDTQREALSKAYDGSVMSLKLTSCGNYVITAGSSSNNSGVSSNSQRNTSSAHTLRLWSAKTGKLVPANYNSSTSDGTALGNTYKMPYDMAIASFTCGGDDLLLYPLGDCGDIAMVPLHTAVGRPVRILQGHLANVTSLLYRQNYNQVLSAGRDGMIFLWEAKHRPPAVDTTLHVGAHLSIDTSGTPLPSNRGIVEAARSEVRVVGSRTSLGLASSDFHRFGSGDYWSD